MDANQPAEITGTSELVLLDSFAQLHELLFDVISDGVLLVDQSGAICDCNSSFHNQLGFEKSEVIGMNVRDIDSPEYASQVSDRMQTLLSQGKLVFETAHFRKDGSLMQVELNTRLVQIGGETFFFSIVRDITEHKLARDELITAQAQQQSLFDDAPDGIFIADLEGRYTDVNHAGCSMLGYERSELIGKCIIDLIREEDIPRLEKHKAQLLAGESETSEWLLRRKNGEMIPVEVSAKILSDGRWQGFVRDISERKQLTEKLYEKDQMYRAVAESSGNGFWTCNLQGEIVEVNDAYCARSGYSREELLGMRIADIEAAETAVDTRKHIDLVINNGFDRFETRHRTKSGETWPVEIFATYWPHNGGMLLVFNTDITERKQVKPSSENFHRRCSRPAKASLSRIRKGSSNTSIRPSRRSPAIVPMRPLASLCRSSRVTCRSRRPTNSYGRPSVAATPGRTH